MNPTTPKYTQTGTHPLILKPETEAGALDELFEMAYGQASNSD